MAVTGSMWQLQDVHGCYGVYVAILKYMPCRPHNCNEEATSHSILWKTSMRSYGTALQEGVTMHGIIQLNLLSVNGNLLLTWLLQ